MGETKVLLERRGGVGYLTLDRPAGLNALELEMGRALRGALRDWEQDPGVRVLVLATFDADEGVGAAVRAGAGGYLLKDVEPAALREGIRVVARGGSLLSPAVTTTVLDQLGTRLSRPLRPELVAGLTVREREVLTLVGRGLDNPAIGRALDLSPATARPYVSRLLARWSVRPARKRRSMGESPS